jgi:STE24 endopeptidase
MTRLSEGTGLSIAGVYRIELSAETVKANAMLAGLGRTRRVLMGDTLLSGFSPDEIEVIFAHEIGHHVFGHIWQMIVLGAAYSLAGFWLANRLLAAWGGPGYDPRQLSPAALPLLMLILTVFSLVLEPLQNALSRRFERQCDRYALDRTGLRGAYRSAFEKLARLNKDDPDPPAWEVRLFHSHPPIRERLALADQG